jgi:chromate reductase
MPDIVRKPTALVNSSPRSTHAQLLLAETLRTMSMHLVADAPYTVPLADRGMTSAAIASEPALVPPCTAVSTP